MQPLADKIRPTSLDGFIGQEHLMADDKPLAQAISGGHIMSFILWGPPGTGKTTIARIYAQSIDAELHELSAVDAGKADLRDVVKAAGETEGETLLFLDEIHRFNKAQQDFLLPYVEDGTLVLVGATTENPSFEVISALLSRVQVFTLSMLSEDEIIRILERTDITMTDETKELVSKVSGGDARRALALVESAHQLYDEVTPQSLKAAASSRQISYDKGSEEHYNTISAFIKSLRASQPDAALYYLARMIAGGEDPKFIARRLVIFASEDVGQAVPTALVVANAAFSAVEKVGLPEAEINLADVAVYLARCKKSRASYDGYRAAQADAKKFGNLEIPKRIRNAPTELMSREGYGKDYKMRDEKDMRPTKLHGSSYYESED
jgi:putative ATPase